MAYKDEYEVARLYTSGDFEKRVRDTFDGDFKIHFNLAPPTVRAGRTPKAICASASTARGCSSAFKLLAKLQGPARRRVRSSSARTEERRMERQLIADYFATVDELLAKLERDNHALAVEIASIPEQIRGYGHIKDANFAKAAARRTDLLAAWRNQTPVKAVA